MVSSDQTALSYEDPPEHWTTPAYSAFSGLLLTPKLGLDQLKSLHSDFNIQRLLLRPLWAVVLAGELKDKRLNRAYRDHVAIVMRYASATADDYVFPEPDLLGRFAAQQYEQFNAYLEHVSSECRIVAGKHVRLACARQLKDFTTKPSRGVPGCRLRQEAPAPRGGSRRVEVDEYGAT
jgi:hypothetical protein